MIVMVVTFVPLGRPLNCPSSVGATTMTNWLAYRPRYGISVVYCRMQVHSKGATLFFKHHQSSK